MKTLEELIFLAEEDIDGGYTAHALGEAIFTEADDRNSLRLNILSAIKCHFDKVVPQDYEPKILFV